MKVLLTAFVVILCSAHFAGAQEADTLAPRQLDELVITATRTERTMGALPMPIMLVPKTQIKTMGSLRLTEVLTEQTGLAVVPQVNGQGSGIQIQGLNPDYTLILLNGEPLIGRYTGSLELSRIAVGNIRQIEIVKGPSSSLYGSDALAGVVNIITDRPEGTRASLHTRYGTNQTLDVSADVGTTGSNWSVYAFGNRYSTAGYDLSPQNFGNTVSPFTNYTGSWRLGYSFGPRTEFSMSGRYFTERQQFDFEVLTASNEKIRTSGHGETSDWNLNPVLTHRFNDHAKFTARFYATRYGTKTRLTNPATDTLYYTDDFHQTFSRPEVNLEYFTGRHALTAGAGANFESVETQRYGDAVTRQQETAYGFVQDEWTPVDRLNLIAGARLDHNNIYGAQISPKLSARYELTEKISLKGSYGVGFKAPDFRQLYLNFNNSAAGGYSVLGTEVVEGRLVEMSAQGLIQGYLIDPALLGKLEAERSQAFNFGGRAEVLHGLVTDVNFFYNSINNLIETQAVAVTTANQTIYSYRNIKRVYTQGIEANLMVPLSKRINVSVGYQLLYAKDADVADQVEKGEVYWRDPETLVTRRLKPDEYFGLYNRSRHMGNVKIFYLDASTGWEASARVIFRGKYGMGDIRGNIQGEVMPPSDINGNGILDTHDNFVDGYAMVNLSVARSYHSGFRFQVGVDNLFDYTDPIYIPNIPGRLLYASIGYTFRKADSNKP